MHEEITFLGRVMEKDETVWFDWTCSGFQFAFEAERVEVELAAVFGEENGQRLTPFLAVFLDDMEMPYQVIELTKKIGSYVLYEGDTSPHRMRVLKRTEAQHTRTGLMQIRTTGGRGLSQWPLQETFKIEFIGDSITCGFGNETNRPEDGFIPCQENGWESYAAKTARKMNAQFHMVSVSGIGLYSSYTDTDTINENPLMEDVYSCTDYYLDKNIMWDFTCYEPDVIIVFLGTNDLSYIGYDFEHRIPLFQQKYRAFLETVRKKNGKHPRILCCLGTMGEELNDAVRETVERYSKEMKDDRIRALLLNKQLKEDGEGGSFHPTIITHEKVSEKICDALKDWAEQDL